MNIWINIWLLLVYSLWMVGMCFQRSVFKEQTEYQTSDLFFSKPYWISAKKIELFHVASWRPILYMCSFVCSSDAFTSF